MLKKLVKCTIVNNQMCFFYSLNQNCNTFQKIQLFHQVICVNYLLSNQNNNTLTFASFIVICRKFSGLKSSQIFNIRFNYEIYISNNKILIQNGFDIYLMKGCLQKDLSSTIACLCLTYTLSCVFLCLHFMPIVSTVCLIHS